MAHGEAIAIGDAWAAYEIGAACAAYAHGCSWAVYDNGAAIIAPPQPNGTTPAFAKTAKAKMTTATMN